MPKCIWALLFMHGRCVASSPIETCSSLWLGYICIGACDVMVIYLCTCAEFYWNVCCSTNVQEIVVKSLHTQMDIFDAITNIST